VALHEPFVDPTAFASHRPWPLPRGPWVMAQVWHDLLFAHWPVPVAQLRRIVPPPLPIDTFQGTAWVGVVPFRMSGVRLRGTPAVPGLSAFPELNVRTYVTVDDKPGVYFFSLDATNPLAVLAARAWYRLPYFHARMRFERSEDEIQYASRRIQSGTPLAELVIRYRPSGPVEPPEPGTLAYFLTERYCLYTASRRGHVFRAEIHHPRWPLQPAEAEVQRNTMADASGITLPDTPPLLHFSRRQDMVSWPPVRLLAPARISATPAWALRRAPALGA
jgi:uncharacterized protein YqjF (DUF2071 family)